MLDPLSVTVCRVSVSRSLAPVITGLPLMVIAPLNEASPLTMKFCAFTLTSESLWPNFKVLLAKALIEPFCSKTISVSTDPSPIKISPPASPILIEPVPALEMLISS